MFSLTVIFIALLSFSEIFIDFYSLSLSSGVGLSYPVITVDLYR
jgi:hypothetical protein